MVLLYIHNLHLYIDIPISADDVMSAMDVSANNFRTMLALNNRLTMVCYGVVAKSAKYVQTEAA